MSCWLQIVSFFLLSMASGNTYHVTHGVDVVAVVVVIVIANILKGEVTSDIFW